MKDRKLTATDRLFFLSDCYILPDGAISVDISDAVIVARAGEVCLGKVVLDALSEDPGTVSRGCLVIVGKHGNLYEFPYTGTTSRTGAYMRRFYPEVFLNHRFKPLRKNSLTKILTCSEDKLVPLLEHESPEIRLIIKARLKGDYP